MQRPTAATLERQEAILGAVDSPAYKYLELQRNPSAVIDEGLEACRELP
jgi:hypothetical protein